MRKIILILTLFTSCENANTFLEGNPKPKTIQDISEEIGYNPHTDSLINAEIDNYKPSNIQFSSNDEFEYYKATYSYFRIMIFHYKQVKYSKSDSWDFSANDINGNMAMLQSPLNIAENKISDSTYLRLKNILITYRNNQ